MEQQVMEKEFNIQQMAQATGLSAHTLRYYERAGLMIEHVGRDGGNGYRSYTSQHVAWIEFLKRLRATEMPIRDIQRYTELVRQGEQTMPERLQPTHKPLTHHP
jgi:DNA-binding transcriptional MerR regulator